MFGCYKKNFLLLDVINTVMRLAIPVFTVILLLLNLLILLHLILCNLISTGHFKPVEPNPPAPRSVFSYTENSSGSISIGLTLGTGNKILVNLHSSCQINSLSLKLCISCIRRISLSLNNVPPGMSFKNLAINTTFSDCLTVISTVLFSICFPYVCIVDTILTQENGFVHYYFMSLSRSFSAS